MWPWDTKKKEHAKKGKTALAYRACRNVVNLYSSELTEIRYPTCFYKTTEKAEIFFDFFIGTFWGFWGNINIYSNYPGEATGGCYGTLDQKGQGAFAGNSLPSMNHRSRSRLLHGRSSRDAEASRKTTSWGRGNWMTLPPELRDLSQSSSTPAWRRARPATAPWEMPVSVSLKDKLHSSLFCLVRNSVAPSMG